MSKYKRQVKVTIPKELARLAGIEKCEYVFMKLDRSGNIIMEAFDARGHRKVKSRSDPVGVN